MFRSIGIALLLAGVLAGQTPTPELADVPDTPGLPRVLLIGDSISIGYTLPVRELLRGKANVHRIPTNGGPTTRGLSDLDQWLEGGKWDVIHFNWGLHDLKINEDGSRQVPLEAYGQNLRTLVSRLNRTGARLIFATTTPVPEGKVNPPRVNTDVIGYNFVARKIMQESGISIDDLYGFVLPRMKEIQQPANVHFTKEGYEQLAERVADRILSELTPPKGSSAR
jgi:GDSL-like lipase/acylhydrolase family protein